MSPAADDERTRRHERGKDRAFVTTIVIGLALIVAGLLLIAQRGAWAFLGGFLFLLGGSFGAASVIGLLYRRKARRVLGTHEWVTTAVTVTARPRSGRNGRTIIALRDTDVTIAVTGLSPEVTNKIERTGELEYAGDLDGSGMLFTRLVDGDEVYVAVVPRHRPAA
ncbi:hypothetical protein [Cumulibacter manganitolerans]|uniref:hypothetical protein n=1 Tax=Cumulibacter manganitolerans TaxID=1884992 RepID=UPI00129555E4|nr:hypothetical protein [Cumulibacter manganitolerans]